jgi:acid stress-induced BolA-like protein IbaG/YrbA
MELKEKVTKALNRQLSPDRVQLEDDDGISGIVVSKQFDQMPALDRQTLIDKALRGSKIKFTKAELRSVLAIAGLTPAEFAALGDMDRQ